MDFSFQSLAFHQLLLVVSVFGCTMLCVICAGFGIVYRGLSGAAKKVEPPFYPESPFPSLRAQLVALVYLVLYGAMAFHQAVNTQAASDGGVSFWGLLLSTIIQYTLLAPVVLMLYFEPKPLHRKRALLKALPTIVIGLLLLFGISFGLETIGAFEWLQDLTGCPKDQNIVHTFTQSSLPCQILIGVSACVLAPIAEECFFRGFLYLTLRRWAGPMAAALCSSLFFACVHGAVVQFLPLLLFALVQCVLYERFRTLLVPIVFHSLFNLANLILLCYGIGA